MKDYGPSRGYASPVKKSWRDSFWERIAANIPRASRKHSNVFMIDASEGLEVAKALKLGFSESNIHVCNASAAIVATLKYRKYHEIQTHGLSAKRALDRIAATGIRLDVISLDFCSCMCIEVLQTLIAARRAAAPQFLIGVNVQRGREQRKFNARRAFVSDSDEAIRDSFASSPCLLEASSQNVSSVDRWRIGLQLDALMLGAEFSHDVNDTFQVTSQPRDQHLRRTQIEKCGVYPGLNGLTMLWSVYSVGPPITNKPGLWRRTFMEAFAP